MGHSEKCPAVDIFKVIHKKAARGDRYRLQHVQTVQDASAPPSTKRLTDRVIVDEAAEHC